MNIGERFGRLTVVGLLPMIAQCDCGNIVRNRKPSHLKTSRLRSCGCLLKDIIAARAHTSNERWSSIEVINPGEHIDLRRCRVTCAKCGVQHERDYRTAIRPSKGFGCIKCRNLPGKLASK